MINKDQAAQMIGQKLSDCKNMGMAQIQQKIHEHMKYLFENYNDLEDELKVICDKFLADMLNVAQENPLVR